MGAVDLLVEVLHMRNGLLQLIAVAGLEVDQGQVHGHADDAAPGAALLLQHVQPAPPQALITTTELHTAQEYPDMEPLICGTCGPDRKVLACQGSTG